MSRLADAVRRYAPLALLGAVHALSFAPGPLPAWTLPFVNIFALAVLAWKVFGSTHVRQAAAYGMAFGFANFAVGLYWLHISMHYYGGMPLALAILAVLVLAAALALFIVLAVSASRWLSAQHLATLTGYRWQLLIAAVWASCWTLAEWLRGTLFTGFPWMNVGYAHIEGMLAPWAPVVGVYGVAWMASFAAGAIGLLARAKDSANDARAAVGVGLAVALGLAGIALGHVVWSHATGTPMIIRLAQGNVPQSEKFDPALMEQGLTDYMQLAALPAKEAGSSPDLIILPETVIPLFQDRIAPAVWEQWIDIARQQNAAIMMGVPLHDVHASTERYTNSAIAFDADTPLGELVSGNVALRYDKQHLVPFGEFVPPGFRWFVDAMSIPLGDFDRGPVRQPLFQIRGQVIAPDICYEDVFGEEIIQSVRDSATLGPGASLLVNMSNLGWFGDSWALRQHLQISRMRALETARPMLRATNTGMTAAIDARGSVRAVLPPSTKGVLDVEVQGMTGLTPYVRWGNIPALAAAILILLAGIYYRRRLPEPKAD